MWLGIQCITDFRPPSILPPSSSPSLPDELNFFYAHFARGNKEVNLKVDLTHGELPLSLSTADVCETLNRVNVWKAAGLDGFLGFVLDRWPESSLAFSHCLWPRQLSPQASRNDCTIVNSMALKDFHLVAINLIIAKCFDRLGLSHMKSCLPTTLDPIHLPTTPTGQQRTSSPQYFTLPDPPGLSQV